MKRKEINDVIIYECKRTNFEKPYTWGEIKEFLKEKNLQFEDNDVLICGFEVGYDEGDSARDDMYSLKIVRKRLENDIEFELRVGMIKFYKEESKKKRYENYLKLKEEFENE